MCCIVAHAIAIQSAYEEEIEQRYAYVPIVAILQLGFTILPDNILNTGIAA